MRLPERLKAINSVADALLAVDERGADGLLNAATAETTPVGWDRAPYDERRTAVIELLGRTSDEVLERLYPPLPPAGQDMVDAVARYLHERPESEIRFLLEQAGVHSFAPSGWDVLSAGPRRSYLALLLRRAPEATEGLHELVVAEQPPAAADPPQEPSAESATPRAEDAATAAVDESGPIFIVHGHADTLRWEAQVVLERATDRRVVVLHQQANSGKTLIEKFEGEAEKAAFAVVLLTGDDEGGAKADGARRPRGRQNVIFELGFFYAKLGRNRVAVLVDEGVEEPSDLRGLVYIPIDSGGGWKQHLGRELRSAGIPYDLTNVP